MTPNFFRPNRALFRLVILSSFAVVNLFAARVAFNIPAQPMPEALQTFIRQSGQQVMFVTDELKTVQANAVAGDFEPAKALALLVENTGYAATETKPGWFNVVRNPRQAQTGAVRGTIVRPKLGSSAGLRVVVKETGQVRLTDRDGEFDFENLEAGSYTLIATGEGLQPMHITEVQVRAGRELVLGRETMREAGSVTELEPYVVKGRADEVTALDKYVIEGRKEKPFVAGNMDLPRTVNDVQPYYIFDSKTIDQSGAINIEDFLKQRLTMNTVSFSNSQNATGTRGNTSSINLRGLGTDETLILVNGRRMAGIHIESTDYQPDLNGIPMSAIERIEVLPSSASGIYGGSAVGGVVNVILKKEYAGGEIRATYDNTWDTDSPTRTLSASYGFALEGGKTQVTLSASWSDAQPLLLQDRRGIIEQNLTTILKNSPAFIYSSTSPFLGALPNIIPSSSSQTTLTLKNGVVLPTRNTYIAAGTSASTTSADLYASLAANAGSWNFDLPASTQLGTGLLQPFGATPENKSFMASVRRQMLPKLEVFADFSYTEDNTQSVNNPIASSLTVPVGSPVNPFKTAVKVRVPDATQVPGTTQSESRNFTVGAIAQLPWGWTGEFDYSRSESWFSYFYYEYDGTPRAADLLSGALNPFVDTLRYPLDYAKYLVPQTYGGSSTMNDFALRGSGPLWSLPWGTPNLTLGLEHRIAGTPAGNVFEQNYPLSPTENLRTTFLGREQETDSGYGELTIPLIKPDWLPLVHALDLQLSGRSERYTVDTGTPTYFEYPNLGISGYGSPNLNGQPYVAKTSYTSTNGTVGLKYQPVPEVTLRASLATAFLPPTPSQLTKDPAQSTYTTDVLDPVTGLQTAVYTLGGGNPDLKPQSSKSLNIGVIWEPRWSVLKGLRLDAEYYRIEQDNAIDSLSAQEIVRLEGTYPDRVTRDATGMITLVDISSLNLYKRETEGWDLSANYTLKTSAGTFSFNAVESIILHLKNQYSLTLPELDAVNFPAEEGAAKYKGNATLTWEWHGWTAGWTARSIGSYKQYGAAGGPESVQNYNGTAGYTYYITAQGSDTIPAQTYHDAFVSYAFGQRLSKSGFKLKALGNKLVDGLTVQLGVRNVFDKVPPFDVSYSPYYLSPYGDMRLRSYWLSVKKAF